MMYMVMNGHSGGYELHTTASPDVSCDPGHARDGVGKRTHRRNRVRPTQTGIMLVHNATETVWSLRTRGMLAGTKL
jgi:hypothetical protein